MLWERYTSREEAEAFFSNVVFRHEWFTAICLDGQVIGSISLDKGKGPYVCKAELGYVLAREMWGRGYATAAVGEAVRRGFDDLSVQRIEAFVDPDNLASQRVLEKNGFQLEGYLRECILHKGKIRDRLLYARVK